MVFTLMSHKWAHLKIGLKLFYIYMKIVVESVNQGEIRMNVDNIAACADNSSWNKLRINFENEEYNSFLCSNIKCL